MAESTIVVLLLPVFLGPAALWAARARRAGARVPAAGEWKLHLLEISRVAVLLVPHGACVALLGGQAGGSLATPTVLGVSFATLFGSAIALVGLLAAVPLLVALTNGRGS